MKVLLVGPNWHGMITEYCELALRELGCQVEVFYYINAMPETLLSRVKNKLLKNFKAIEGKKAQQENVSMNHRLLAAALDFQPDKIIIIKGETILPETLRAIKKQLNVMIGSWWVDNPLANPCWENVLLAKEYLDHLFVFDPSYVESLLSQGFQRVSYLPFACSPSFHKKIKLSDSEFLRYASDLSFLGIKYDFREKILNELAALDLKIWGLGWKNVEGGIKNKIENRFICIEEAVKIYNASKIVLNINHPQSRSATNTRTFEAAACGAFQLTEKKPEMEHLFVLGKEAVCYGSVEELKELIDYYLQHSDERKKIAELGQQRVYKDHTYKQRLQQVLAGLG